MRSQNVKAGCSQGAASRAAITWRQLTGSCERPKGGRGPGSAADGRSVTDHAVSEMAGGHGDKYDRSEDQARVRPLEEKHPHLKQFGEFLEDFNNETEPGAALAAAAFIDDLLEQILTAFLVSKASADKLLVGF